MARETGIGLPGCEVSASYLRGGEPIRPGPRPGSVTTTGGGTFELVLRPPVGATVQLRIAAAGRVPVVLRAAGAELGARSRVSVQIERGVVVTGRLRDQQGAALDGKLQLFVTSNSQGPHSPRPAGPSLRPDQPRSPFRAVRPSGSSGRRFQEVTIYDVEVEADGTFGVLQPVRPGVGRLWVHVNGMRPVGSLRYELDVRKPADLQVVMEPIPHLRGIVVDDLGAPVANVRLKARNNRYGPEMLGTSGADGRFEILRTGPAPDRVIVQVLGAARCEPSGPIGPVRWGRDDLRIVLQRSPLLPIRVETQGGRALESFSVRTFPIDGTHRDTRLQLAGRHAKGRVEVPVRRGDSRVVIVPDDPRWMPQALEVVGAPGMAPRVVRLQRMKPMQVDVVDDDGAPVAGITVEVVVPGNFRKPEVVNDERAETLRALSSDPATRFASIVYRTKTDAGGRCVVFGPPDEPRLRLRLWRVQRSCRWFEGVRIADGVRQLVW